VSYVKLPKTTQDHAVGYQSVNQARDNDAALFAQFDAKHSVDFAAAGSVFRATGRHDDPLIARSVLRCSVETARAVPTLAPIVSGPVFGRLAFTRLQQGQWRIYIATPQLFFAVALCESTAAVDRKATAYRTYDPSTGPAVIVTTWERVAGTWTPTDLAFSLVVWCEANPA